MFADTVCDKANEQFNNGEYSEALQSIERCIQVLRRSSFSRTDGDESKSQLVLAKMLEARIYLAQGNEEIAEEKFDQIKSSLIGNDSQTYYLRGKLYQYLAEISKNSSATENEIMDLLSTSKENYKKANASQEVVELLFQLKSYPNIAQNREKLLETFDEIDEFNKQVKDKNTRLLNSGLSAFNRGRLLSQYDPKQSYSALRNAKSEFSFLKFDRMELKTDYELIYLTSQIDFKSALKEIERLNDRIKKEDETEFFEQIISKFCDLKIKTGETTEIFSYIDKVIATQEELEKTDEIGDGLLDIAKSIVLYSSNGSDQLHPKAIDIAQKARDHFDASGDKAAKAATFIIEALAELNLNQLESAKSKLQLVKVLTKNLSNSRNIISRSPWKYDFVELVSGEMKPAKEVVKLVLDKYHPKTTVYGAEIIHLLSKYMKIVGKDEEAELYAKECAKLYKGFGKISPKFKEIASYLVN